MSLYKLGIACTSKPSKPSKPSTYQIGAWFATMTGVRQAASQMNRDIEQMDLEMIAHFKFKSCANVPIADRDAPTIINRAMAGDPAAQLAIKAQNNLLPEPNPDCVKMRTFYDSVWRPFVTNWEAWWSDHDSWWDNFSTTSTYNKIDDRRTDLIKMRAAAQSVGFAFAGPAPTAPDPSTFGGFGSGLADVIKTVAIVGAIAVVAFLLLSRRGGAAAPIILNRALPPGKDSP